MIKEEYINSESLDDNSLLMQYFKKHDADNNLKLDGLELLKALAKMDRKSDNLSLNWQGRTKIKCQAFVLVSPVTD